MEGNPGTLGLSAGDANLAMVSQVRCTGVISGAGWNDFSGAVGTAGVGVRWNIPVVYRVPVAPAWRSCVGTRLSVAAFLAPC